MSKSSIKILRTNRFVILTNLSYVNSKCPANPGIW